MSLKRAIFLSAAGIAASCSPVTVPPAPSKADPQASTDLHDTPVDRSGTSTPPSFQVDTIYRGEVVHFTTEIGPYRGFADDGAVTISGGSPIRLFRIIGDATCPWQYHGAVRTAQFMDNADPDQATISINACIYAGNEPHPPISVYKLVNLNKIPIRPNPSIASAQCGREQVVAMPDLTQSLSPLKRFDWDSQLETILSSSSGSWSQVAVDCSAVKHLPADRIVLALGDGPDYQHSSQAICIMQSDSPSDPNQPLYGEFVKTDSPRIGYFGHDFEGLSASIIVTSGSDIVDDRPIATVSFEGGRSLTVTPVSPHEPCDVHGSIENGTVFADTSDATNRLVSVCVLPFESLRTGVCDRDPVTAHVIAALDGKQHTGSFNGHDLTVTLSNDRATANLQIDSSRTIRLTQIFDDNGHIAYVDTLAASQIKVHIALIKDFQNFRTSLEVTKLDL